MWSCLSQCWLRSFVAVIRDRCGEMIDVLRKEIITQIHILLLNKSRPDWQFLFIFFLLSADSCGSYRYKSFTPPNYKTVTEAQGRRSFQNALHSYILQQLMGWVEITDQVDTWPKCQNHNLVAFIVKPPPIQVLPVPYMCKGQLLKQLWTSTVHMSTTSIFSFC